MNVKKSQIIATFLVGFVASTISGGAPIMLVTLLALLFSGALVWTWCDLTLKWRAPELRPLRRHFEHSEIPKTHPDGLVLGLGHHARR